MYKHISVFGFLLSIILVIAGQEQNFHTSFQTNMKQLEEKLEAYKKEIVELVKEFKKYMEHPSNELKQDVVKQSKMIENQLRTLEKQAKKLKFNRGAAQSFTRCQRKQLRHIIFSIQNYIMVPTDILAIFSRNPNGKHCNGDSIEFN